MKKIALIVFTILCSAYSYGQVNNTLSAGNETGNESADTTGNTGQETVHQGHMSMVYFADFGESVLRNTSSANGLTWALSAQLAYRLKPAEKVNRVFITAGLEVRNYNVAIPGKDGDVTTYDNLHYWYAGVPVTLNYVNGKHKTGHLRDVRFYAQAGITFGIKVMVSEYYSDAGVNTKTDVSSDYNRLLLHPFASVGITYSTKGCTLLLGPYFDYAIDHAGPGIVPVVGGLSGIDGANIMSFGLRLSLMPGVNNK